MGVSLTASHTCLPRGRGPPGAVAGAGSRYNKSASPTSQERDREQLYWATMTEAPLGTPRGSAQLVPAVAPDCPLSGLDGWRRRGEEAGKQDHLVRSALGKGREWGSSAEDLLSRRFHLECQAPSPQGRYQPEISPAPQALDAAAAVHRHLMVWRLPRPALLSQAGCGICPWADWPGGF